MLLLRTVVFWKGGLEWISIRSGWLWELLAEQEVKGNLRLGIARLLLHLFKLDRLIGVLRLRCHRFKDYGIFQKISTSTSRQIKTFRLFPLYFNEILSNLCKKIFSANIVGRFCRLDFLLEVFYLGEWKSYFENLRKTPSLLISWSPIPSSPWSPAPQVDQLLHLLRQPPSPIAHSEPDQTIFGIMFFFVLVLFLVPISNCQPD